MAERKLSGLTPELVEQAMAGGSAARDGLVRILLPEIEQMARAQARKYPWIAWEDFVQEGIWALLNSLNHFDPSRGPFLHYVRSTVRRQLGRYVANMPPLVLFASSTGSSEDVLNSMLARSETEAIELGEAIQAALAHLPPIQCQILEWHFGLHDGQPRTLAAVARLLGLRRDETRQALADALTSVRQELHR